MARKNFYLTGFGTFVLQVSKTKLVNIQSSPFKEVHKDENCLANIGRKSVCKGCNKEVTTEDIIKGIPTASGQHITFTKEEIKSLHPVDIPEATIEVIALIDAPHYRHFNGDHHQLTPQPKAPEISKKGMELFLTALSIVRSVALVRYFDCSKTYHAIISPDGIMSGIYYSDEVIDIPVKYEKVTDTTLLKHLKDFALTHIQKFQVDITKDVENTFYKMLAEKALEKQMKGLFDAPKIKKVKKANAKATMEDELLKSIEALKSL